MKFAEWQQRLWEKSRFKELIDQSSGDSFERLFQQIMKAVYGADFVQTRLAGPPYGDIKCDGWRMTSNTCYAAYGTLTVKERNQVRAKVERDLKGALRGWPTMRAWRFVDNDYRGLNAVVLSVLVELRAEAESSSPGVEVLPPWSPSDLWSLLQNASDEARLSVLGAPIFHEEAATEDEGDDEEEEIIDVEGDPVSVSARRSVTQLRYGFVDGGILDSRAASVFARTLTMSLFGSQNGFDQRWAALEQCCGKNPLETMLTLVAFCERAVRLWEAATGDGPELWAEMIVASGESIPYVTDVVLSARFGIEPPESLPGDAADQRLVTMNLGRVTAATIRSIGVHRVDPLISVLQDLFIAVQRVSPGT